MADIFFMNLAVDKNNIDTNMLSNFIEPVFYFGLNKNRKLPACINPVHAFNCFEYRLKQKPNDLSCHLQRIQLSMSEKNRDKLFAAICDLFIILGPLGLPLRQRLFIYCKKALNQKQTEILNSHLGETYLTSCFASLPDNCIFKKTPVELIELCNYSSADTQYQSQDNEDVLHVAESYIENSQFDTALNYMLTQLEQDPENEELTKKLLSIYKALEYTNEFQSAYNKFSNYSATSEYWNDMKQYFLNQ